MTNGERQQRIFPRLDSAFFVRAAIAVLALALAAIAVSRLIYPFDTGNAEALSWIPASHLLAGENPYSLAFEPPFIMSAYGVVYYAIVAVGVALFGFELWWIRILSVLCFAICIWAAAKIVRHLTASREAVFVTVLAGLSMLPMQMWIGLMRSDLIAAAFASAALCLAFTVDEKNKLSFRRVALIVFLAALAFFTKHTYLLPACFIFLRFVQIGKVRQAVVLIASFAAAMSAGVFLLDYGSSGGYVWQHFVHARDLPFAVENLRANFPATVRRPALLFLLIFLLCFLYEKLRSFGGETGGAPVTNVLRSPRVLILIYFAATFSTATISSGRVGANVNYYIENSFAAIIICGFVYDWFRRGAFVKLSFALVFSLALSGAFQAAQIARGEYFRWQSLPYYREIYRRTGELSAREANPVCLSVAPELVLRNGCALEFIDYEEYESGWSPELREIFERRIKSGSYAAIIWHNGDRFAARFPNYRLVKTEENLPERFSGVFLYERVNE